MYSAHFGCRERPFDIVADPRFVYANPAYEEAYAALLYGIQDRRGCIALVGEAGTGKTTLLHRLLESLDEPIRAVFFDKTTLTFEELLDFLCRELALPVASGRLLEKIEALNEFLLERQRAGGTGVLIIDEAQNLSAEVLENLRLLSNFEAANEKLLQLVLVGQPELEQKLERTALRQLKQRIVVRCQLDRLPPQEVGPFILHRLRVAGCERQDIFSPDVIERVAAYSTGIPRLINVICDNAMLIAYGAQTSTVSKEIVEEVARDLRLTANAPSPGTLEEQAAMTAIEMPIIQRSEDATLSRADTSASPLFAQHFSRSWVKPVFWGGGAFVAGLLLWSDWFPAVFRQTVSRIVELSPSALPLGAEQSANGPVQQLEERPSLPSAPQLAASPSTPEPDIAQQANVLEETLRQPASSADPSPPPTPPAVVNGWKGDTITIAPGDTISRIAIKMYGGNNLLAFDLIKELNPHIEDLDRIAVGEKILFPALTRETLVRPQPDGSSWLILGSFYSEDEAEKLARRMRHDGHAVTLSPQNVFGSRLLYRVTLEGLKDPTAVEQAWLQAAQGRL
jgi:general secretion pathway protein A